MISLNKIFFAILISIIFFWLIINTFWNQNYKNFDSVYYNNVEKWLYWLEIKNDELIFSTWSKSSSWLIINYFNQFDKIINYTWEIETKFDKTKEITLKKWMFLINFSELNWKYQINWEWFSIDTKWPTSVFIDNSWVRTLVFSINSNIELKLINIENNKVMNYVYLYPHNYIKIIPNQNKNVENADLLRLIQRFPLEYFNETLLVDSKINENIVNNIIWKKDGYDVSIIENMFLFLYLNNNIEEKYLKEFKTSKFWILIWERFIKQYNKLFLNNEKKSIYYKNLILRTIGDIILSEKIDNSKNDFLISTLKDLKTIDEDWYNEMKNMLVSYSNLVIDGNKDDINSKINFSKIYNELENTKYDFNNDYSMLLSDLYFKYDFKKYLNIYKDLNDLNKKVIDSKISENQKSYFILFLNKNIIYWFENLVKEKSVKLDDLLNLFNDYISTSIEYYSNDDDVRIRTWIENYNEILKKLAPKIKETYFEKDRDNQWLLVLNNTTNINIEKLKILQINIESILNYFDKYKSILWDRTKDDLTKNEFLNSKNTYNEYIIALKDYNSYIANFSEQNKQLLFWDTVSGNDDEIKKISIENAKLYLSKFDYIDISITKISIRWYNYCENKISKYDADWAEEAYCYKIENLLIWNWLYLNMTLSPENYNNISNFVINWDKNINKWSYKLDNEKIVWDDNYKKNAWRTEIEKYNFKNFFLYIFNPPKINDTNENNEYVNTAIVDESLIVKIFKRNKLLWINWDFQNIISFINITYDDVIVSEKNENYDIYVKKWEVNLSEWLDKYSAIMSSKYIFLPDHSFINPEFVFYDSYNNILYNWSKITIIWKFEINNFKNSLIKTLWNLKILQEITWYINNNLYIKELDIQYNYNEATLYINSLDNNLKIIIKWIAVKSVIYNWKEYIKTNTSTNNLWQILELINK